MLRNSLNTSGFIYFTKRMLERMSKPGMCIVTCFLPMPKFKFLSSETKTVTMAPVSRNIDLLTDEPFDGVFIIKYYQHIAKMFPAA